MSSEMDGVLQEDEDGFENDDIAEDELAEEDDDEDILTEED